MKVLSKKFKKAFSLVETLITLIVVSIIILMLSNVLAITLKVSVLARERSHIKNETANMFDKLDRDVSNAEYVYISDPADPSNGVIIIETADYRVRWERCTDSIAADPVTNGSLCQYYCAIDLANSTLDDSICPPTPANGRRLNYITSSKLEIESFRVEEIDAGLENQRIKSAVVTIKAKHARESLEISNIYKQITISSNNFII